MLRVRPYTDDDRSYVIACWLRDYFPHAVKSLPSTVSRADFDRQLDSDIKASLANGMRVLIAYDDEFPTVIIGWIAFGPGLVLHYAYVQRKLRGQGVGMLLSDTASAISFQERTHETPDAIGFAAYSSFSPNLFPVRPS